MELCIRKSFKVKEAGKKWTKRENFVEYLLWEKPHINLEDCATLLIF